MNSTATRSTWRGMCSVRLPFARDSPCNENKHPYNTVIGRLPGQQGPAFRRTPGRSCQVCYRCINKDPWKRQYHHRHMEHKDTKSSRETSGTNTRNGQVLINIPRLCEKRWKNFGEITTEEGHKVCSMEKEDKHEHGVGFIVHKVIHREPCHVMGCRPVSSKLQIDR